MLITTPCSGSSDDNLALMWPIIKTNVLWFLEGRQNEMMNLVRR